jgi:hypothetical protein
MCDDLWGHRVPSLLVHRHAVVVPGKQAVALVPVLFMHCLRVVFMHMLVIIGAAIIVITVVVAADGVTIDVGSSLATAIAVVVVWWVGGRSGA